MSELETRECNLFNEEREEVLDEVISPSLSRPKAAVGTTFHGNFIIPHVAWYTRE